MPTQVIEATSKRYKRIMLEGYGLCLLGLLLVVIAIYSDVNAFGWIMTLPILLIGLGVSFYGRSMAWWHHG